IEAFLSMLANAGLLQEMGSGSGFWEIHPALAGFLRSVRPGNLDYAARKAWLRSFVGAMAMIAEQIASLPFHEHRAAFSLSQASFHSARGIARGLQMGVHYAALTQALAGYAESRREFPTDEGLSQELAEHLRVSGMEEELAAAMHQLGMVALERRNWPAAEEWYRKSLAIFERLGYEEEAAGTYEQLGNLALERRDFAAAEDWSR